MLLLIMKKDGLCWKKVTVWQKTGQQEKTVIGIPEKEAGSECIIVDDWLRLYTKPTVEGKGRDIFRHENAKLYDWAMPEEL